MFADVRRDSSIYNIIISNIYIYIYIGEDIKKKNENYIYIYIIICTK
jgi:hypothetical protein